MFLADPQNPLLPAWDELIVGVIAFVVVFGILGKVLLPRINKTLADRTDAIEGGIARAEDAQAEAQRTLEEYRTQLAEARHEAARLRQEAQEQGASIIATMRQEGQRQRDNIVVAGQAQIDAERAQAQASLRSEVGRLAVELAGRIVGESLEDEARQRRTVDRFLADLESAPIAATAADGGEPEQVH